METENHTPGPWAWFGDPKHGSLYLATVRNGRRFVMDFARMGMRGAQPRFQEKGVMIGASELCTFEVGEMGIVGMQSARSNPSIYRYDISGIDHPDARLIAAAPDLLEFARAVARYAGNSGDDYLCEKARAAIAEVTGEGA